ncbi:sulfatase [Chelativorans xinjiangense]|uniref:sulfatase n=1 Tax=Chelativorans xinjiangense TaxID=2681485 RepID=UPI001359A6DE|nr:sulfatase [Chelativorans xinjiangense]
MRTIFVLFDSLNRRALGAYGGTAVATPNFDRFAQRAVTFDTHYVGSLPCMPARRDMHTGRLNFTHRPWGPLEPFDNSYTKLLGQNGVYTHLVSDHLHYLENGGWGYANAFDSWDFVRGQEYDPVKVMTTPPVARLRERFDERHYPLDGLEEGKTATRATTPKDSWRRSRHATNMLFTEEEEQYPTPQCFARAVDFLNTNREADDWFLQIECFDPHEPFAAPERFRDAYKSGYGGRILDWPVYEKVTNSELEVAEIRANYAALVAMCDEYFGRLLDWMDETDAWKDTALILTTDHGFLLGEHEWWGKNKMPYYEEISHIPLMIWHPGTADRAGARVSDLTQTTDLMPTILGFHEVDVPKEVTSFSMEGLLRGENGERESAIFGMFAGPICVTDGRYTYFRFPENREPNALPLYTVMPSHLEDMFSVEELAGAQLVEPFDFTKGVKLMRMHMSPGVGEAGFELVARWQDGSCLFDLERDPDQSEPIRDPQTVERLTSLIEDHLRLHDAAPEVFAHYALVTERPEGGMVAGTV